MLFTNEEETIDISNIGIGPIAAIGISYGKDTFDTSKEGFSGLEKPVFGRIKTKLDRPYRNQIPFASRCGNSKNKSEPRGIDGGCFGKMEIVQIYR